MPYFFYKQYYPIKCVWWKFTSVNFFILSSTLIINFFCFLDYEGLFLFFHRITEYFWGLLYCHSLYSLGIGSSHPATPAISFYFVTLLLLSTVLQLATALRNIVIFSSELYVDFSIYLTVLRSVWERVCAYC